MKVTHDRHGELIVLEDLDELIKIIEKKRAAERKAERERIKKTLAEADDFGFTELKEEDNGGRQHER